jgi:hypothetical protein
MTMIMMLMMMKTTMLTMMICMFAESGIPLDIFLAGNRQRYTQFRSEFNICIFCLFGLNSSYVSANLSITQKTEGHCSVVIRQY